MKTCSKCKIEKNYDSFEANRKVCISCRKKYNAEYYSNNKLEILAREKEYKQNNKEKINLWNEQNRDKRNKQHQIWRKDNKEHVNDWKRKNYQNEPRRSMVWNSKGRAKKRGLEHDIKFDDFEIPKNCPVLNIPIMWNKGKSTDNSPTIDRIDNSKGYTQDNIQIISWRANCLKRDATFEEIEKLYFHLLSLRNSK